MAPRAGIVRVLLASSLLAAFLAAGCGAEFTRQNFETVYVGMPARAVERKLGPPQERTAARWVYTHRGPYYRAEIVFRDGRVAETVWSSEPPEKPDSGGNWLAPGRVKSGA